jgi:parvulin-like peptidyl-prolyl isomerase
MKSTMKSTNQIRTIAAALLLAVISFTAIGSNSKTDTGKGQSVITSAADENGMNIFSRIAAEINKSISNNRMILRLSGINLPNHSN